MSTPIHFLSVDEVIEIDQDQIARHGGLHAVRDGGILESAVMAPEFTSICEEAVDLPRLAAAYMTHIIRVHPFVDGNKRTGVKAALVFLLMNGVRLSKDPRTLRQLETLAVAIACGEEGEEAAAKLFRGWAGR